MSKKLKYDFITKFTFKYNNQRDVVQSWTHHSKKYSYISKFCDGVIGAFIFTSEGKSCQTSKLTIEVKRMSEAGKVSEGDRC